MPMECCSVVPRAAKEPMEPMWEAVSLLGEVAEMIQNEHIASCLPLKLTSGIAQEHDFGLVHMIICAVRDFICCLEFRDV